MAYIPDQQINTGQFVSTTNVWDIGRLYDVEINSDEFKELLVRLYQNVNNIALSLNNKESGYYIQEEFVNSGVYFNPTTSDPLQLRPVFRKIINVGAVNAGVTNAAHGLVIASTWSFTRIYGAVSNTTTNNYLPLPWASAAGITNIELSVNAVNVVVTNNSGLTFPTCTVVLEYLKQ